MEQPLMPARPKEQHVTELAGPDDAWVSVTDASRVARRQEHTIRTWIRDGLLPVHPERTGLNKRTRRVRLSDLAKLTPILDIDAAIATEVGQLDLVSIPRQQQQIKQEHDLLLAEQAQLHRQLAAQEDEHQRDLATMRAAWQERLAEQQQRHTEALAQMRSAHQAELAQLRALLEETRARFGGALDALQRTFDEQQQQHTQFRAEIHGHLQRDRQAYADALQRLEARIEQHADATAASIGALRQEQEARFTQEAHARDDALQALKVDLADMTGRIGRLDQATQHGLEQFAERLDVARSAALEAQSRLDQHNEVLQAMRRQLLEEQQARAVLASRVAALVAEQDTPSSRADPAHQKSKQGAEG